MTEKKQYRAEEKFLILKEAEERGVVVTCKRHGVDPTTYYVWKERYASEGIEGLVPKKRGRKLDLGKTKELEKENAMLKKLLLEKTLEVEMQSEIIKKNCCLVKRRKRS